MKLTRDPVTNYPAVEIGDRLVVLEKGTTPDDIEERPAREIVECGL
jgi:hypothetical protein